MTSMTDRRRSGTVRPGWVVGVDTHTDTHAAALVDQLGAVHAEVQVTADPAGYERLSTWAVELAPTGQPLRWSVEGTRSHGQGLARHLRSAGHTVFEAPKPVAGSRRRGGKSDPIDAVHAARAVLATDRHATPRADGAREALRLLIVTRRHHTDTRTATVNLFKSVVLGAGQLREALRGLRTPGQVNAVLAMTTDPDHDLEAQVRLQQLRLLAATITELDTILADNYKQIRNLVTTICPALPTLPGVGPHSAAVLLTAWSHRGRLRNDAAFAALAGVSPLVTGSGRNHRHRLNRGGDRTLNSAIHTIAVTRRRMNHPATSTYIARRTAEGHTPNDILRSIKRYIARQLFRVMEATTP